MRTKIVVTALALLAAYFATYFGSGLREIWIATADIGIAKLPIFVFGVVALVFGVFSWASAMGLIIGRTGDETTIYFAAGALVLLSATFGLVHPFALSPYPWKWVSMWGILLALAIVPTVLELVLPKPPRS